VTVRLILYLSGSTWFAVHISSKPVALRKGADGAASDPAAELAHIGPHATEALEMGRERGKRTESGKSSSIQLFASFQTSSAFGPPRTGRASWCLT